MSIDKIIGEKLSQLQKQSSLSQEEMGKIIGVSRQTMAKYLKGDQIPDSENLIKLASHFNKPLSFFLDVEKKEITEFYFMYRAEMLPKKSKKDFPYIEKRFNDYYEVIQLSSLKVKEYIPEQYEINISGKDLTKEDKKTIEKIASKQRSYMGIGEAINIDVYSILENNFINIIAEPLYDCNIDAVSAYGSHRGAFIFVNDREDISEERKIFSTIHELGHLILHRKEYATRAKESQPTDLRRRDIREKAADFFASCFLIPPHVLKEDFSYELQRFIPLHTVVRLKEEFGVSAACFITTLNKYGLINDKIMGALFKQLNKQGNNNSEPKPKAYIPKNQKFHALIRNLVMQEKISINKASQFLGLTVKDARQKLKNWLIDYE